MEFDTQETLLMKALCFASEKHQNQKRNDGSPYIYHPLQVAYFVKDMGYPIQYQVVALLHDVLEDTDTSFEELLLFGEDIAHSVELLTRIKGMDEEIYVRDILQDPMAAVVKNADKINNLMDCTYSGKVNSIRSQEDRKWELRYIEKAKKYYQGQFSKALDLCIEYADKQCQSDIVKDKYLNSAIFSLEDTKLYIDCEE